MAARGDGDSRRRWRGSLARFLLRDSAPSRAAARRADAPHPAAPHPAVTHRGSCAPRAGRAGRHAPGVPIAGRKVTAHRAGTPRIVRAGPSSVKGTRRSFLTASQKRSQDPPLSAGASAEPSGPDGEGQARGQAPSARGETSAVRHLSEGPPRLNDVGEWQASLSLRSLPYSCFGSSASRSGVHTLDGSHRTERRHEQNTPSILPLTLYKVQNRSSMATGTLELAHHVLGALGYNDASIRTDYPVWLGRASGTDFADMVAFGRSKPMDMSTATITVALGGADKAYRIAQALASPYMLLGGKTGLDLWVVEPTGPRIWQENFDLTNTAKYVEWLKPTAALRSKVGLRQLPLFDIPVNLLANARDSGVDRLGPIVTEALEKPMLRLVEKRQI